MIINMVMGNIHNSNLTPTDFVRFDWYELGKKRLRKISDNGVDIGFALDEPVKDGDIVFFDDNNCIVVSVNSAELTRININSIEEMGRLCFELGNRHLSLKITDKFVDVIYDKPTFEYLLHIGFNAEKVTDKFTGYIECKAHGSSAHSHSHDHGHSHSHQHKHAHSHD